MAYTCIGCGTEFNVEAPDGQEKPRCPKCMRMHGVERSAESVAHGGSKKKALTLLLVGGGLLLVGGSFAVWKWRTPDAAKTESSLGPLSGSEVKERLAKAEVDAAGYTRLLEAGPKVKEAFKKELSSGDGLTKAEALLRTFAAAKAREAYVPWSFSDAREQAPRAPEALASAWPKAGSRERLFPLELAALMTAALRSADVPAMMVEVYGFEKDTSPPDPTGHYGYYGVAVYPNDVGEGTPTVFDPYGGHAKESLSAAMRVLTDTEAIGAALNHRALHELSSERSAEAALKFSEAAAKLDQRSPNIRGVHGAILLATGVGPNGMAELEAAAQLRPDGPRYNNLAGVLLAKGDVEGAARHATSALKEHPGFAAAHGTLAAVYMARGDQAMALKELEVAERIDPRLVTLPMLKANYYATSGDVDRAVRELRVAAEARPGDVQVNLMLAQLYKQLGKTDDMRAQVRRMIVATKEAGRAQLRALVEQLLGPDALDSGAEGGGDDVGLATGLPSVPEDLKLGGGSKWMDDERPSTDEKRTEKGGPVLMLGDGDKLKLSEPGSNLHLDLNK